MAEKLTKYQYFIAVLFAYYQFTFGLAGPFTTFSLKEQAHRCHLPSDGEESKNQVVSFADFVNFNRTYLPHASSAADAIEYGAAPQYWLTNLGNISGCRNLQGSCNDHVFTSAENMVEGQFTALADFGLFCENKSKTVFVWQMIPLGYAIACFIANPLADKYGRKSIILASSIISLFSTIAAAFGKSLIVFQVSLCLQFMSNLSKSMLSAVYAAEVFNPEQRVTVICISTVVFNIAAVLSTPLVRFLPSWRHTEIVLLVLHFIEVIPSLFIKESSRWLNVKEEKNETSPSFWKCVKLIFGNKTALIYHLCLTVIWTSINLLTYCVVFSSGHLGYDMYITNTLIYSIGLVSRFAGLVTFKFGRKLNSLVCFGSMTLILLAILLFFNDEKSKIQLILSTSLVFFGGIFFTMLYIWQNEIMPTEVRSSAMGLASGTARVIGLVVPIITELSKTNLTYLCHSYLRYRNS